MQEDKLETREKNEEGQGDLGSRTLIIALLF
jgi:hypothetical protein